MLLPRKMSPEPVETGLMKVLGRMGSPQHTSARGSQRREDRRDALANFVLHNTHAAKARVAMAAELVAEKTQEKGGLQSGGTTDIHALILDGVRGPMWSSC